MNEQPNTRMYKVWAGLAASMLVGCFLLSWLEPESPVAQTFITPQQATQLARHAIADRSSDPQAWSSVDIVAMPETADPTRLTLTAFGAHEEVHFLIARDGHVYARPSWQRQDHLDPEPVIRIGLVGKSEGRPPATQIIGLKALLGELGRSLAGSEPAQTLPVRHNELAGRMGEQADAA